MTETRPDVAVVLPCYNPRAEEIAWTLDSLRAQTVPFKLFVVDDGSRVKPDYRKLLAGFDHELIELPHNVGPMVVRNPAVERAMAEGFTYIAQIDCGDWAFPARIEMQRAYFEAHPDVVLLGAAVEVLDEDMRHAYDYEPYSEPDELRRALYYNAAFKHPALMYRTSLLRQIGIYSDEFDAAEDYDLERRAALVGDLANVPTLLLKTVEYKSGVSLTRRRAQLLSRLRIQWRYRDLSSIHCWLGIAKTLLILITPTALIRRIKPLINRGTAPRPGGPPLADHS